MPENTGCEHLQGSRFRQLVGNKAVLSVDHSHFGIIIGIKLGFSAVCTSVEPRPTSSMSFVITRTYSSIHRLLFLRSSRGLGLSTCRQLPEAAHVTLLDFSTLDKSPISDRKSSMIEPFELCPARKTVTTTLSGLHWRSGFP